MDSYLIKKQFRQDLQDLSFLSQFPEETEKTQSDFVGEKHFTLLNKLLNEQNFSSRY